MNSTVIEISWEPPPVDTQNGIIRQYSIYIDVQEEIDGSMLLKTVFGNLTSIIVSGLHPYYTYTCRVAAVTIVEGPHSVEVTTRTLESGQCFYYFNEVLYCIVLMPLEIFYLSIPKGRIL